MSEFLTSVRIYYEDTDSGGIVYYANYLKYMERARTEYLREHGFEQQSLLNKHRRMFVVRSVQVDYRKPARLDDLLLIKTRIVEFRRASLVFGHVIMNPSEQEVCSAGITVACLDADSFRPVGLPAKLVEVSKH